MSQLRRVESLDCERVLNERAQGDSHEWLLFEAIKVVSERAAAAIAALEQRVGQLSTSLAALNGAIDRAVD